MYLIISGILTTLGLNNLALPVLFALLVRGRRVVMICGRPRVRPPLSVLLPVAASTDSPTPTVTIVGRRTGSDGNKTMISDNYIDSNLFFHPHRVLVGGGKGRTGFKVVAVHKERMYYFSRRKKSKLYEINKHTEHAARRHLTCRPSA
jgi:hypothetical protein